MATKEIKVPNIGDASDVEVIEVMVSPGKFIKKDESLITLESEKASMEIPSPLDGKVEGVAVKVGDKVSEGSLILTLSLKAEEKEEKPKKKEVIQETPKEPEPTKEEKISQAEESILEKQIEAPPEKQIEVPQVEEAVKVGDQINAGPVVRRIAREFGIDLRQVTGSGPKHRIQKEDLEKYVKATVKATLSQGFITRGEIKVSKTEVDFSKFGKIETKPLNKIKRLTGVNVHNSWITIPHVTQFGRADITDMEEFRKVQKTQVEKEGIKLTPLVFIMKAIVAGLKTFPHFNASLDSKGENLILKGYFNLGIAVDTPNGLVVPVIREVDKKGMLELARELRDISQKARQKGLSPAEMSGSCFTISSLGGIGGTAFTPIINAPDVAILGLSKAEMSPVYVNGQFIPRLMLPLSLSYDHRVIDGAEGARFLVYLTHCLSDIRTLLL